MNSRDVTLKSTAFLVRELDAHCANGNACSILGADVVDL